MTNSLGNKTGFTVLVAAISGGDDCIENLTKSCIMLRDNSGYRLTRVG